MKVSPAPTHVLRAPLADDPGFLIGTDGSAWLYREVPRAPVSDARTPEDRDLAAQPINGVLVELANSVSTMIKRRSLAKGSYREIHLLSSITPGHYRAPEGQVNKAMLDRYFGSMGLMDHNLLLGVRLFTSVKRNTWRQAVKDFTESMIEGGASLDDYSADLNRQAATLRRYGFTVPTQERIDNALGWFNNGNWPDIPTYPHGDHLHLLPSWSAARVAERAVAHDLECTTWGAGIEGHQVMTITCLNSVTGGWEIDSTDAVASWATRLHRHGGTRAISVRAQVEPAEITRREMRLHRKEYEHDLAEARAKGQMDKAEAEQATADLAATERAYAQGGPPTLTQCRVTIAIDGQFNDPTTINNGLGVSLVPRLGRQDELRAEMGLCSEVRENPHVKDWPAQMLAASGIGDTSIVGDGPSSTVILGFTEHDQQPVGYQPDRAGDEDQAPVTSVTGDTGTGKTQLLLWMASQEALAGRDVVSIGPKAMAKADLTVQALHGQPSAAGDPVRTRVVSLSDISSSDGILDPFSYTDDISYAVGRAVFNILSANPWGTVEERSAWEAPLTQALRYGAERGARSTGQALDIAREGGAPPQMVDRILGLAQAYPQFRAFVGTREGAGRHSLKGWTHVQVGSTPLNLPSEDSLADGTANLAERIDVTLVRALVNSYVYLLRERGGSIYLDEAWVFMLAGRAELDQAGRLMREYGVSMVMFNQKVSEALSAGLEGYFSRNIILPLTRQEAQAALLIADKDLVTEERINRLRAKPTKGEGKSVVHNWDSMRHLVDPATGQVLRGTIAYYADMDDHFVPFEIVLPREFLELSTTNAAVLRARRAAERQAARK